MKNTWTKRVLANAVANTKNKKDQWYRAERAKVRERNAPAPAIPPPATTTKPVMVVMKSGTTYHFHDGCQIVFDRRRALCYGPPTTMTKYGPHASPTAGGDLSLDDVAQVYEKTHILLPML